MARGRLVEPSREAPPTPPSVHADILPPHEQQSIRGRVDLVENWLHQAEPAPQLPPFQAPYECYRDSYYEPVRRPYNIQGEAFPAGEAPKENKMILELKEQLKALTQKVAENSNDLTQIQNYNLYPEARYPVGFKMPVHSKIYWHHSA